jgi:hypothetical protein
MTYLRKSDAAWAADHRYVVEPGGKPMPGVTTIIHQLEKPLVTKAAVRLTREGKDHVAEWKVKSDLGTRVHNYAEERMRGHDALWRVTEPSDEPYLEAWEAWHREYKPIPLLVEPVLIYNHPELGYGGRPDLVCQYGIVDYKTGRHFLVDPMLQLNAYDRCSVAVYEDGWLKREVPLPRERGHGLVTVYLNGDGTYEHVEVPNTTEIFSTFLSLRAVYGGIKRLEAWERAYRKDHA